MENIKTFDQVRFFENFNQMEDLALEIINDFILSLPSKLSDIKNAIASNNVEALELSAHSLKGSLSSFYAEPSALFAWQLEQLGKGKSIESAKSILAKLENEVEKLVIDLRIICDARRLHE